MESGKFDFSWLLKIKGQTLKLWSQNWLWRIPDSYLFHAVSKTASAFSNPYYFLRHNTSAPFISAVFWISYVCHSSGLSVAGLVAGFRVPFVIGSRLQTRSSHSSLIYITEQRDLRPLPRLQHRLNSKLAMGTNDRVEKVTPQTCTPQC